MNLTSLRDKFESRLADLRIHLAHVDALPLLALLGVFAGAFTALVILLFRLAIEIPLNLALGDSEAFESVSSEWRFFLPIIGSLCLAGIFHFMLAQHRRTGIGHVLERIQFHQGQMPLPNWLAQFIGGIVCAVSGQSTGREGPAVHLGAGTGSFVGRYLQLPTKNNQLLMACGVAAAISTSFNTPIAGVIFALEVILQEYRIIGFIPVILASVTGALFSQAFYGNEAAFIVPSFDMRSLWETPLLIVIGLFIGSLAAGLTRLTGQIAQRAPDNLWARLMLIGVANGALAVMVPGIMGIGYDSVNQAIFGNIGTLMLLTLLSAKLLITGLNIGLAQPGGIIGPMLFVGAMAGGVFGHVGQYFFPEVAGASGYYAMLGMAAMMAACLQAPLAGLMTLMELTGNPNIILPGMLVVVIASMTYTEIFKQKSLFQSLLLMRGLDLQQAPIVKTLRNAAVVQATNQQVKVLPQYVPLERAQAALQDNPRWIVIEGDDDKVSGILAAADLSFALDPDHLDEEWLVAKSEIPTLDLMALPAKRKPTKPIFMQANLQEALDLMHNEGIEALTVHFGEHGKTSTILGVVEADNIHNFYRYKH
ncbi:MAG: chloride channel protein [Oceanospirillaceae bacterium]|nr:chloride channel protein [Oceanospirillaceae bacterium]